MKVNGFNEIQAQENTAFFPKFNSQRLWSANPLTKDSVVEVEHFKQRQRAKHKNAFHKRVALNYKLRKRI